jgi:hypothetical protein
VAHPPKPTLGFFFTIIQPRLGVPTAIASRSHLVEPLENAPRVILGNWVIHSVVYDRTRLILRMNTVKGSNM